MADVVSAITYVLRQEDAHMSGIVTANPRDSGGRTRFGVAEKFHPELTSTGFFDAMAYADALLVADGVYKNSYGVPLMLASIANQQVANALLSFAINEGVKPSVLVLQNALRSLDAKFWPDGDFGPVTLAAVNTTDAASLLTLLGVFQKKHYTAIVAANPTDGAFVNGWLNRVAQDCKAA